MGWFLDSLEWTSGKLLSAAGHMASWAGAADTGELLKSAGNPSYVAEAYTKGVESNAIPEQRKQNLAKAIRLNEAIQQKAQMFVEKSKPIVPYSYVIIDSVDEDGKALQRYSVVGQAVPVTKEGRARQAKDAKELNSDLQKAAANTETALISTGEAIATLVTLPMGGWGGFGVGVASDVTLDGAMHLSTSGRGQAPPRTLWSLILPNRWGGNERYKKGATPLDYFDEKWDSLAEAEARVDAAGISDAGYPNRPVVEPENGNEAGFLSKLWKTIKVVINSIVNAFKASERQVSAAASRPKMAANLGARSISVGNVMPTVGIPVQIQNTERRM